MLKLLPMKVDHTFVEGGFGIGGESWQTTTANVFVLVIEPATKEDQN